MSDPVNHPKHYTSHPSGVECITVTEHMGFNLGNAVKYIWRADEKGAALEDLRKAAWYLQREITKREGMSPKSPMFEIRDPRRMSTAELEADLEIVQAEMSRARAQR